MNGRTHMAAGLFVSTAAAGTAASAYAAVTGTDTLTLPVLALGSMAAAMASTLPDCDQYDRKNKNGIGKLFHCMVMVAVFCFLLQWLTPKEADWQYAMFYILAIFAGILTEHRSATHSIAALFGYSWLFYRMTGRNPEITIWFFLAYASHLALDFLNKRGEMLFWPVMKKRFCLRLTRSESWLGKLIFKAAAACYTVLLAMILYGMYKRGEFAWDKIRLLLPDGLI
ncbi:MAG: metal-dependent hydrolase [Lachnospiraceae bacterium]|nr:metal-dependent hydrolase [Lachnospiraceae bacterium]